MQGVRAGLVFVDDALQRGDLDLSFLVTAP